MTELGDWSVAGSDIAEPGAGELQITVGSGAIMTYKDPQTGLVISNEQISASLRRLDTVMGKLWEGRKVFNRVYKETGDYQQAQEAGNETSGGSFTQIMNGLCNDHVLVSMVVICPPCGDTHIMKMNEQRLRIVIKQINEFLYGQIADIFTSRKEIGQVSQSFVYVRFPYYLAEQCNTLATALSQVSVGSHQFKASVTYDGRAKLTKSIAVVEQWDIEIAGHKIPSIPVEELAAVSNQPHTSFEQQYKMRTESEKNNTFSLDGMDDNDAHAELSKSLWNFEISHIYDMQTYRLAKLLQSHNDKDNMQAYFQIAGLVIEAADKGVTDPAGITVRCFEATKEVTFVDSAIWLCTKVGNCYLTLDAPFETYISDPTGMLKKDGTTGSIVTFCLQYSLGGPTGMAIVKAGLAFVQHLSSKKSLTNLLSLGNVMKLHLADFASKLGAMQAREHHASATSSSQNCASLTQ